ncbi:GTP-binding protein [Achromobacter seleniivolatilans]|uniref:GTP-binding protein n=1 Tax=Achromobacter seleniivolatilans TaxID=3047478 RepID=A0ABY9M699_9BURK|nr:GTP-binding protein [Achromobacter sp. R39]WMD22143.1 GTP-binding protein [Achromobacter sp. R39]
MHTPSAADFIVVCGFLGSGKTTLISSYLESTQATDTAVIVNDVGEINVDGAVLAMAGDLTLARLANGCVCCSLGNELLDTIEGLIEDRRRAGGTPFRRFILECSGISDPAPIVRSLATLGAGRFRVKIVCTYSCLEIDRQIESFAEAVSQLAVAHVVVITKMDLVDAETLERARRTAAGLAPLGRVSAAANSGERFRSAFSLEDADILSHSTNELPTALRSGELRHRSSGLFTEPHPRISVYQLTYDTPMDWMLLQEWLENLIGYFGDRVLRIKGIVRVTQSADPILIQSVGVHVDQPREVRSDDDGSALFVVLRDATSSELTEVGPRLPLSHLRRLSGLTAFEGRGLLKDRAVACDA